MKKKLTNYEKILKLKTREIVGKCLGLADGKIVVMGKSVPDTMDILFNEYKDKKIAVVSLPKKAKTFVL